MTIDYILIGRRMELNASHSSEGSFKKLWNYGWGLLFVIAMTVLSVCCPRLGDVKDAGRTMTTMQGAAQGAALAPVVK